MGRKIREERQEKREDYAAKISRNKRKSNLMAAGILTLIALIFADRFDFSVPTYQIKSSWIHFEESDGTTIHRHASGVTLSYLFETMNIIIDEECYLFPDGRQFCTNEDYSLKYYLNHKSVDSINDYVIQDGDRILITFGNETPEQIEAQLTELAAQIIKG